MAKWFRTRLREARESRGLSQAELAMEFGVTQVTISNWENGTSEPRDELYNRVVSWIETVGVPVEAVPQQAVLADDHGDQEGASDLGWVQVADSKSKGPAAKGLHR